MLSVVCVLAWLIDWWLTVFFVLYRCCRFVRVMKSVSGNGVICIAWVCSCPRKIFLKWTSFLVIPHFWICGNNGFGYNVGIIWEIPNWSLWWGVMWLRIHNGLFVTSVGVWRILQLLTRELLQWLWVVVLVQLWPWFVVFWVCCMVISWWTWLSFCDLSARGIWLKYISNQIVGDAWKHMCSAQMVCIWFAWFLSNHHYCVFLLRTQLICGVSCLCLKVFSVHMLNVYWPSEFVLYLTPEQVTGSFYLARLVGETALSADVDFWRRIISCWWH